MTPAGWLFMVCSLGLVIGLAGFCYWRVLTHAAPVNGADAEDDAT